MFNHHKSRRWTDRAFAAAMLGAPAGACASDISSGVHGDAEVMQAAPTYVVVADDARFYSEPSLEAGSIAFNLPHQSEAPWKTGLTMQLVESRGGWVRVQSRPLWSSGPLDCADHPARSRVAVDVAWDAWVQESNLIPVLVADTRIDFDDGTWAEFTSGTMVQMDRAGQPNAIARTTPSPVWAIPLPGSVDGIGLAFSPSPIRERSAPVAGLSPPPDWDRVTLAGVVTYPQGLRLASPHTGGATGGESRVDIFFACGRAGVIATRDETGILRTTPRCGVTHYRPAVGFGSILPTGTTVRTRDGAPVGQLQVNVSTSAPATQTEQGLTCFSAATLRTFSRDALPATLDDDPDRACFSSSDILVDPIWAIRDQWEIEFNMSELSAVFALVDMGCETCRHSGDMSRFFGEQNPAATTEIALLSEFHGRLERVELIWALRHLGETEMAEVLFAHFDEYHHRMRNIQP